MSDSGLERAETFSVLSRRLLEYANRGLRKTDFVREISELLQDFSKCDSVEIRLIGHGKLTCFQFAREDEPKFHLNTIPYTHDTKGDLVPVEGPDSDLEWLCARIIQGNFDHTSPHCTARGSFRIGDTQRALVLSSAMRGGAGSRILRVGGDFKSLVITRFIVVDRDTGLLILKSRKQDFFLKDQVEFYEEIAQIIGISLNYRRAQVALRERVKELTCLFGIARIAAKPDIALDELLQATAELLPPAWLYPDVASAKIVLDGRPYITSGFREDYQKLTAAITLGDKRRGTVEVAYSEEMPELGEGPFLKEERSLLDAIAREISLIIERRQAEEDRENLREQLRHADRLATIGQLAAGVAHELNEPLGSILGFAQLVEKDTGLPEQVKKDIDKIIAASLHGREVIKKLMIFARQTPPQKRGVNLNKVVEDGLLFFESRCAKAGIELRRVLQPDLPDTIADQSQLHQVLINLVVNAIQAMPDGGCLTIGTASLKNDVCLSVQDTGIGMEESVLEKLFIPFFTTKDVNEGTGLGLSVVHGIANSHGGSVTVESEVGKGSLFVVRFPLTRYERAREQGDNTDAEE